MNFNDGFDFKRNRRNPNVEFGKNISNDVR